MKAICILGAGYVGTALYEVLRRDEHNEVCFYDPAKGLDVIRTDCCAYIICVPTPLREGTTEPDYSMVTEATKRVAEAMDPVDCTLVIVESTVGVGTCNGLVNNILEASGKPYDLCFSPERVSPGEVSITSAAKIVSGKTQGALQRIIGLYSPFFEIHVAPSMKVAEMAKLTENVQRDVNIALMNELNMLAEQQYDIDFSHVLAACRTKWNFADFRPGLVGGHCIAVDPWYLIDKNHAPLMRVAREVNDEMPRFIANCIIGEVPEGTELIVLLGENYKPGVKDTRNAGVAELYKRLRTMSLQGFTVPVIRLKDRKAYDAFMAASDFTVFTIIGVDEEEFSDIDGLILFN